MDVCTKFQKDWRETVGVDTVLKIFRKIVGGGADSKGKNQNFQKSPCSGVGQHLMNMYAKFQMD